jgi:hypothetical protein
MTKPQLTFACESASEMLEALCNNPTVISDLLALDARVAMGLIDLNDARAACVRKLNRAGVPLVAWLLLPKEQGYWCHAGNAAQAADRYYAFLRWSQEHGLCWSGVGLDIEPDISLVEALRQRHWRRAVPVLMKHALDGGRLRRARAEYGMLVTAIRRDGYPVETYQIPLLVDERRAHTAILQRLLGVVDVPADREVLMLYSSFLGPLGTALLWSYGCEAQVIGVGSTGGGVELSADLPLLDGQTLVRDLLLAAQRADAVFVFSLEGCVQQGLLSHIRVVDWELPIFAPPRRVRLVNGLRAAFRSILWVADNPAMLLTTGLLLLCLAKKMRTRFVHLWAAPAGEMVLSEGRLPKDQIPFRFRRKHRWHPES